MTTNQATATTGRQHWTIRTANTSNEGEIQEHRQGVQKQGRCTNTENVDIFLIEIKILFISLFYLKYDYTS